jgi:Protein of unknown function (DUF3298)/Deacetylase PdaC
MKIPSFSPTISVLILVVFIGLLYFFGKPNNEIIEPGIDAVVDTTPDEIAELVDISLVETKKFNDPSSYIVFDISYPQFKNAPESFNLKIEELVLGEAGLQRGYAEENWNARYDTSTDGSVPKLPKEDEKFSFTSSFKVIQANNNFISVLISISGYSGGAHGYQNLYTFNYDVKTGKEITLKDLFPNDSNYLKTISEFVRKDLEVQLKQRLEVKTVADKQNFQEVILPMLRDGTTAVLENFSIFTFTPTSITIYFVEYQIGPYSIGESTVVIPR